VTAYPKTTIRLTAQDKAIIAGLRERLGLRTTTDVIRLALRTLDAQAPAERRQTVETLTLELTVTEAQAVADAIEAAVAAIETYEHPNWANPANDVWNRLVSMLPSAPWKPI